MNVEGCWLERENRGPSYVFQMKPNPTAYGRYESYALIEKKIIARWRKKGEATLSRAPDIA